MLMQMSHQYIHYSSEFGIGRIEFYNDRGNSMTSDMLREITAFIRIAAQDPEINLLVIQSGGQAAFCGGASLDELYELDSFDSIYSFFMGFADLLISIRTCPKLVLVRVQGKCVGGGVGLIAAADLVFATSQASVRLSELSIGIGPFVIGEAVERKIGKAAFSELTYLSSIWKDAGWAKDKGLYAELFETVEAMDQAMVERVVALEKYDSEAVALNKKMLWDGASDWDKKLLQRAEQSAALWMKKKIG